MYRTCPGCRTHVPQGVYACRDDWYRLPQDLRLAITTTYKALDARNGQTIREYQAAKKDGDAWFAANPKEN
jgi:hypothetical protein